MGEPRRTSHQMVVIESGESATALCLRIMKLIRRRASYYPGSKGFAEYQVNVLVQRIGDRIVGGVEGGNDQDRVGHEGLESSHRLHEGQPGVRQLLRGGYGA